MPRHLDRDEAERFLRERGAANCAGGAGLRPRAGRAAASGCRTEAGDPSARPAADRLFQRARPGAVPGSVLASRALQDVAARRPGLPAARVHRAVGPRGVDRSGRDMAPAPPSDGRPPRASLRIREVSGSQPDYVAWVLDQVRQRGPLCGGDHSGTRGNCAASSSIPGSARWAGRCSKPISAAARSRWPTAGPTSPGCTTSASGSSRLNTSAASSLGKTPSASCCAWRPAGMASARRRTWRIIFA